MINSRTIDTPGFVHTNENLYGIAIKTKRKCQSEFQYSVCSVVTDNTGNVDKTRKMLGENENGEFRLAAYGCAAENFNVLACDVSYSNVN